MMGGSGGDWQHLSMSRVTLPAFLLFKETHSGLYPSSDSHVDSDTVTASLMLYEVLHSLPCPSNLLSHFH